MDGHNDGLGHRLAPDPPWIKSSATCDSVRALACDDGSDRREIQPGRKMIAMREHDADPRFAVRGKLLICLSERLEAFQIKRVALLGSVDPDHQHVSISLDCNSRRHRQRSVE